MLAAIMGPLAVQTVSVATNDYNVRTAAGSPAYPLRIYVYVNANIGSTGSGTPALQFGTGWTGGSWLYILQKATITGATGTTGIGPPELLAQQLIPQARGFQDISDLLGRTTAPERILQAVQAISESRAECQFNAVEDLC